VAAAKNPVRGSAHHNAKLNEDDVRLVLQLVAERDYHLAEAKKLTNEEIAKKFDVHVRTIDRVTQRSGWIHVPDPGKPEQRSLL
jgi:transcription initiation factor IIF auxiliary subunit